VHRKVMPAAAPDVNSAFRIFAEVLHGRGYSPLPIVPGQKRPTLKSWSDYCAAPLSPERIRDYAVRRPRAGLGVALGYGGVIALDVDTEEPEKLAAICAAIPPSPVAKAGAKGWTAFYRTPAGVSIPSRHFHGLLDLLGAGTQTVLPPSLHPAGYAYRWLTPETLQTVSASQLPEIPADIIERLEAALAPWMPAPRGVAGEYRTHTASTGGHELRRLTAFARAGLANRARDLAAVAEGGRNNALYAFGAGLGRYVHHGVLTAGDIEQAALSACEANGLLREDGRLAVLATLHKGISRAAHDALPALKDRRVA
jgi:hypothetical protein